MLDLGPAADRMATLLRRVVDDQLTARTPCPEYSLGDLLDHVDELALAFTAAARKDVGGITAQGPSPDAARLGPDWRERIPARLDELAEAWRDPSAWEGMTRAGGIDLPGAVAGQVALTELVVHGWDLARASEQPFDCDPESLHSTLDYVAAMADEPQEARDGLFGPVVTVAEDAGAIERMIGLTGRNPQWTPR